MTSPQTRQNAPQTRQDAPQTRQDAKAQARESAASAPPADPDTAAEAIADAHGTPRPGESHVNPVYKTQEDIAGDNTHRPKEDIISEFDSPSDNTV